MIEKLPVACGGPGEAQDTAIRSGYDMSDLLAENRRLRAGLDQMQGDVLRLSRALEPMHRLNEELARLRDEAEQLGAAGQSHRERIEQLTGQLAQLQGEAAQLRGEVAQLRGEVAQLKGEAEQLRHAGQVCREHNAELEAAGQTYRERIEQLAGQLQDVYESTSWRLTRPIRWLKRCLSGIIRRSTLRN